MNESTFVNTILHLEHEKFSVALIFDNLRSQSLADLGEIAKFDRQKL